MTEDAEQSAVVQYLELIGARFTAIPNSTYNPHFSQQAKNKRLGLRAGFPDMVVIVNDQFFCIEMKRVKGGVVSAEQKGWLAALETAGIAAYVCRGFDEAKLVIDGYRQKV